MRLLVLSIVTLLASYTLANDFSTTVLNIDNKKFIQSGDQLIDADVFNQGRFSALVAGSKPANVTLWEDGVLPIQFANNVGKELQDMVWAACAEWSEHANVKCVKGPYKRRTLTIGRSYMGNSSGCWSMLGSEVYFMGIKRRMTLGHGCDHYSVVLHELGHSFGITHEHQRPDRDKYVDIFEENVDPGFANFNTKLNFNTQAGDLLTPYDFDSIMHYSRRSFSKNGKDTIVPKGENKSKIDSIGRAQHLSEYDIISIQTLYGRKQP